MKTVGENLAIHGDAPVREEMLPYSRQWLDEDDIALIVEVLRSDWLTTGPKVAEFEENFAQFVSAREAVVVSNGTAALHTAMSAVGIEPGDEVIVPAMTFAASANCVVYQGGKPVFVDVHPDTLLLDISHVEAKITHRTKAIIAVDYTGQPCNYDSLREIADRHNLWLIADACHALGATYKDRSIGSLADLSVFSFHPVKHITTGEGGAITTADPELARRMRIFRNHGINGDHRQRAAVDSWYYEMVELGFNYRITDFQCALGLSQLQKLPRWLARRRQIAARYNTAFKSVPEIEVPMILPECNSAWHLYVIRLNLHGLTVKRKQIFEALRAENIGVNVHYIPVHLHPYYRDNFGYRIGQYPEAEKAYVRLISLPIFPGMSDQDAEDVILAMHKVTRFYAI